MKIYTHLEERNPLLQSFTDIKPITLGSGIWFVKSIREIKNALHPVIS